MLTNRDFTDLGTLVEIIEKLILFYSVVYVVQYETIYTIYRFNLKKLKHCGCS